MCTKGSIKPLPPASLFTGDYTYLSDLIFIQDTFYLFNGFSWTVQKESQLMQSSDSMNGFLYGSTIAAKQRNRLRLPGCLQMESAMTRGQHVTDCSPRSKSSNGDSLQNWPDCEEAESGKQLTAHLGRFGSRATTLSSERQNIQQNKHESGSLTRLTFYFLALQNHVAVYNAPNSKYRACLSSRDSLHTGVNYILALCTLAPSLRGWFRTSEHAHRDL